MAGKERFRGLRRLLPSASPFHDPDVSRGMVLALGVGIIAGLGAVLFRSLIGMVHEIGFEEGKELLSGMGACYVILVPAAGGLIVAPLIYFFAREAKGHGVPEVMIAVTKEGGRIRPRGALVKILASAITIGTGGSVGREGPIVQIGSTVGSVIAQRLGLPREWTRSLVACGAADGITAFPDQKCFFSWEPKRSDAFRSCPGRTTNRSLACFAATTSFVPTSCPAASSRGRHRQ